MMGAKFLGSTQAAAAILAVLAALFLSGCSAPSNLSTPQAIKQLTITGLTPPKLGSDPLTSLDTSEYTAAISWSPTVKDSFAPLTTYTASITIIPKEGNLLTKAALNKTRVDGAVSVTYSANTGVVKALYPPTFGTDYTSENIGTLRYIPPGRFQRDSDPANVSVITKPYRMSQDEITRSQFMSIMGIDPSHNPNAGDPSHPVQMVTWYDAVEFCNKLSIAEGLTPVYTITDRLPFTGHPITSATVDVPDWDADGYRLPTEIEWVWAALGAPVDGQGGRTNTTGYARIFAGASSGGMAFLSETKTTNELGLCNMRGKIWEWCWDWYGSYPPGSRTDFRGAPTGSYRVVRGGNWIVNAPNSSVAYRINYNPSEQYKHFGFRVIRH